MVVPLSPRPLTDSRNPRRYKIWRKLYALSVKSGGGGYDYSAPDVTERGTLNSGSYVDIATTKKARLVVLELNNKASNDPIIRRLAMFEVGVGGTQLYVNTSNVMTPYTISDTGVSQSSAFITVTNNNVRITNPSSTLNSYYIVAIYY